MMSSSSSRLTPEKPRIESDFRNVRNYQVYQQAVCIALLNSYFEVSIIQPLKKAHVFEQIIRIEKLQKGEDVIFVEEFCKKRCRDRFLIDTKNNIPEKTAKRRTEANKVNEMQLLLMDLLGVFGFFFETKRVHGKKTTVKGEFVQRILFNGKVFLDKNNIYEIGKNINRKINVKLGNGEKCTLPVGFLEF
ncbi:hypothetical protein EIN_291260 [Entamoeba invadens IP1]|uniref:Uncharacterized protein n=1 Tax=Entamoeba invadens IP1 TaxID=370355 RepID=A0A0A1UAH5_ENTIV|nr:hypothetical protein EIN_291260 [Entamoeba invadens IP1]ELP92027.1 hypothetical protein EIN_291260 [Entamoeba invadens IP1]|eukprot:XP_004258798.1 hypothetical protein EIN_291260 [Entamoeba invadens IP1]